MKSFGFWYHVAGIISIVLVGLLAGGYIVLWPWFQIFVGIMALIYVAHFGSHLVFFLFDS